MINITRCLNRIIYLLLNVILMFAFIHVYNTYAYISPWSKAKISNDQSEREAMQSFVDDFAKGSSSIGTGTCWKSTYPDSSGSVSLPGECPGNKVKCGLSCCEPCAEGYESVAGLTCRKKCPPGWKSNSLGEACIREGMSEVEAFGNSFINTASGVGCTLDKFFKEIVVEELKVFFTKTVVKIFNNIVGFFAGIVDDVLCFLGICDGPDDPLIIQALKYTYEDRVSSKDWWQENGGAYNCFEGKYIKMHYRDPGSVMSLPVNYYFTDDLKTGETWLKNNKGDKILSGKLGIGCIILDNGNTLSCFSNDLSDGSKCNGQVKINLVTGEYTTPGFEDPNKNWVPLNSWSEQDRKNLCKLTFNATLTNPIISPSLIGNTIITDFNEGAVTCVTVGKVLGDEKVRYDIASGKQNGVETNALLCDAVLHYDNGDKVLISKDMCGDITAGQPDYDKARARILGLMATMPQLELDKYNRNMVLPNKPFVRVKENVGGSEIEVFKINHKIMYENLDKDKAKNRYYRGGYICKDDSDTKKHRLRAYDCWAWDASPSDCDFIHLEYGGTNVVGIHRHPEKLYCNSLYQDRVKNDSESEFYLQVGFDRPTVSLDKIINMVFKRNQDKVIGCIEGVEDGRKLTEFNMVTCYMLDNNDQCVAKEYSSQIGYSIDDKGFFNSTRCNNINNEQNLQKRLNNFAKYLVTDNNIKLYRGLARLDNIKSSSGDIKGIAIKSAQGNDIGYKEGVACVIDKINLSSNNYGGANYYTTDCYGFSYDFALRKTRCYKTQIPSNGGLNNSQELSTNVEIQNCSEIYNKTRNNGDYFYLNTGTERFLSGKAMEKIIPSSVGSCDCPDFKLGDFCLPEGQSCSTEFFSPGIEPWCIKKIITWFERSPSSLICDDGNPPSTIGLCYDKCGSGYGWDRAGSVGATATGAIAGAAAGNIVPGIGVGIGAAAGAAIGSITSASQSCWLKCDTNSFMPTSCADECAINSAACVGSVINKTSSVVMTVVGAGLEVVSLGSATPAVQAANKAAQTATKTAIRTAVEASVMTILKSIGRQIKLAAKTVVAKVSKVTSKIKTAIKPVASKIDNVIPDPVKNIAKRASKEGADSVDGDDLLSIKEIKDIEIDSANQLAKSISTEASSSIKSAITNYSKGSIGNFSKHTGKSAVKQIVTNQIKSSIANLTSAGINIACLEAGGVDNNLAHTIGCQAAGLLTGAVANLSIQGISGYLGLSQSVTNTGGQAVKGINGIKVALGASSDLVSGGQGITWGKTLTSAGTGLGTSVATKLISLGFSIKSILGCVDLVNKADQYKTLDSKIYNTLLQKCEMLSFMDSAFTYIDKQQIDTVISEELKSLNFISKTAWQNNPNVNFKKYPDYNSTRCTGNDNLDPVCRNLGLIIKTNNIASFDNSVIDNSTINNNVVVSSPEQYFALGFTFKETIKCLQEINQDNQVTTEHCKLFGEMINLSKDHREIIDVVHSTNFDNTGGELILNFAENTENEQYTLSLVDKIMCESISKQRAESYLPAVPDEMCYKIVTTIKKAKPTVNIGDIEKLIDQEILDENFEVSDTRTEWMLHLQIADAEEKNAQILLQQDRFRKLKENIKNILISDFAKSPDDAEYYSSAIVAASADATAAEFMKQILVPFYKDPLFWISTADPTGLASIAVAFNGKVCSALSGPESSNAPITLLSSDKVKYLPSKEEVDSWNRYKQGVRRILNSRLNNVDIPDDWVDYKNITNNNMAMYSKKFIEGSTLDEWYWKNNDNPELYVFSFNKQKEIKATDNDGFNYNMYDFDCSGNDFKSLDKLTELECREYCNSEESCTGFSYNGNNCKLKTNIEMIQQCNQILPENQSIDFATPKDQFNYFEHSLDCIGNDNIIQHIGTEDINECQNACSENGECTGVSFSGLHCVLRRGITADNCSNSLGISKNEYTEQDFDCVDDASNLETINHISYYECKSDCDKNDECSGVSYRKEDNNNLCILKKNISVDNCPNKDENSDFNFTAKNVMQYHFYFKKPRTYKYYHKVPYNKTGSISLQYQDNKGCDVIEIADKLTGNISRNYLTDYSQVKLAIDKLTLEQKIIIKKAKSKDEISSANIDLGVGNQCYDLSRVQSLINLISQSQIKIGNECLAANTVNLGDKLYVEPCDTSDPNKIQQQSFIYKNDMLMLGIDDSKCIDSYPGQNNITDYTGVKPYIYNCEDFNSNQKFLYDSSNGLVTRKDAPLYKFAKNTADNTLWLQGRVINLDDGCLTARTNNDGDKLYIEACDINKISQQAFIYEDNMLKLESNGLCVDIHGSGLDISDLSGTYVFLHNCNNSNNNQRFAYDRENKILTKADITDYKVVKSQSDNLAWLQSKEPKASVIKIGNECLTASTANLGNKLYVEPCDTSDPNKIQQQSFIYKNDMLMLGIDNSKCIDSYPGQNNIIDYTGVSPYVYNCIENNGNQKFLYDSSNGLVTRRDAPLYKFAKNTADNTLWLQGRVINLEDGCLTARTNNDGDKLYIEPCNINKISQQAFVYEDNMLKLESNGLCVDIHGSGLDMSDLSGTYVFLHNCNASNNNQRFAYNRDSKVLTKEDVTDYIVAKSPDNGLAWLQHYKSDLFDFIAVNPEYEARNCGNDNQVAMSFKNINGKFIRHYGWMLQEEDILSDNISKSDSTFCVEQLTNGKYKVQARIMNEDGRYYDEHYLSRDKINFNNNRDNGGEFIIKDIRAPIDYYMPDNVCYGNDFVSSIYKDNYKLCAEYCNSTSDCKAFAYDLSTNACNLRNVFIQDCTANKNPQDFNSWIQFDKKAGNELFAIQIKITGECLTAKTTNLGDKLYIEPCDTSDPNKIQQQSFIYKNDMLMLGIDNSKCIDSYPGQNNIIDYTGVSPYVYNCIENNSNQKFLYDSSNRLVTRKDAPLYKFAKNTDDNTLWLQGRVINLEDGCLTARTNNDGDRLYIEPCDINKMSQQAFVYENNMLKLESNGLCVDIHGSVQNIPDLSGTYVFIHNCNTSNNNQRFAYDRINKILTKADIIEYKVVQSLGDNLAWLQKKEPKTSVIKIGTECLTARTSNIGDNLYIEACDVNKQSQQTFIIYNNYMLKLLSDPNKCIDANIVENNFENTMPMIQNCDVNNKNQHFIYNDVSGIVIRRDNPNYNLVKNNNSTAWFQKLINIASLLNKCNTIRFNAKDWYVVKIGPYGYTEQQIINNGSKCAAKGNNGKIYRLLEIGQNAPATNISNYYCLYKDLATNQDKIVVMGGISADVIYNNSPVYNWEFKQPFLNSVSSEICY